MKNIDVIYAFHYQRKANARHLFTDGITLYSYGYHFPIAKYKDHKILINKDRYSRTTSIHQGHLARILGFANHSDLIKGVSKTPDNFPSIVLATTEQIKG